MTISTQNVRRKAAQKRTSVQGGRTGPPLRSTPSPTPCPPPPAQADTEASPARGKVDRRAALEALNAKYGAMDGDEEGAAGEEGGDDADGSGDDEREGGGEGGDGEGEKKKKKKKKKRKHRDDGEHGEDGEGKKKKKKKKRKHASDGEVSRPRAGRGRGRGPACRVPPA